MNRFRKILLVEGERRLKPETLERAVALARRNEGELSVLSVLPPPPRFLGWVIGRDTAKVVWDVRLRERSRQLKRPLTGIGVPVAVEVVQGHLLPEVLERVESRDHDLVLTTASESTDPGRDVTPLFRNCPCPVWVLRPGAHPRGWKVLAAVDIASPDGPASPLNVQILEMASSLAEIEGAELHISAIWSLYGEKLLRRRTGDPQELAEFIRQSRREHRKGLEELLAAVPAAGDPAAIHLRRGRPAEGIRDIVDEQEIDVLIMGTAGRTGLPALLVGNTSESVLDRVRCDVIAVKHEERRAGSHEKDRAA